MNMHVETPVSGGEKSRLGAKVVALLDASELQDQTFKILRGLELISTLVQTEMEKLATTPNREHEAFLDNVEFLASTLADTACHVLDSLPPVAVSEIDSGPSVYESRGLIEV
jgi:hypothetical protein